MFENEAAGMLATRAALCVSAVCRRMCHGARAACAADVPAHVSLHSPAQVSLQVSLQVSPQVSPVHHRTAGACLAAVLAF